MAVAHSAGHLRQCVVSPAGRHSASLIFLHGSGDSGQGLRHWIKNMLNQDLTFQHIKIIYPTAPCRPYTPMRGGLSNVWFDRFKISNDCPEHLESIDGMCQVLTELIDDEVKNGIHKNRILIENQKLLVPSRLIWFDQARPPEAETIQPYRLQRQGLGQVAMFYHDPNGGFSMGGCMAIHLAYRKHQDVAGVFALSSFLNKESAVYKDLQQAERTLPELFQCHGTVDELVLHAWGEETNSKLKSLGVSTVFHSLPNLYHEMNKTELESLKSWILTKLPGETVGQNE